MQTEGAPLRRRLQRESLVPSEWVSALDRGNIGETGSPIPGWSGDAMFDSLASTADVLAFWREQFQGVEPLDKD